MTAHRQHAANGNSWTIRSLLGLPLAFLLAGTAIPAQAQTQEFPTKTVKVLVEQVATGLENPWAVEVLPDGAYLVTERPGRMRLIRDGNVSPPIGGLPEISAGGQGGLLDVALDPQFADNRTLYFTASINGPGGRGTAVFSAKLAENGETLTDVNRLFAMNRFTSTGQHFGSRIVIDDDGTLYFGIGDRGEDERAQDPRDHAGSIMRINRDGSVPDSNPFVSAGGALPEIWSIGHRNPQGITMDPADGTLYTVEHGARGGDEINTPEGGRNYGWPVISYGKHYSGADIGVGTVKEGMEQPIYYWDPSIAPGAIAVYRGEMFPEWDGNFLVAALKYQLLARLERDSDGTILSEERLFGGDYGRIRDVVVAPDGSVLMVTDESDGTLLRIVRAPS